jgi:hypothetical protein
MTNLRISFAMAFVLALGASALPNAANASASLRCTRTLAQYTEYARELEPFADRARAQADDNPLYESDAQYYAAELNDARQCIKNLSPAKTASR